VAFAAAAGAPSLAHELCYHVQPAFFALALAGLVTCAAVLLGLWYPRRLVQRRLSQALGEPMSTPAAGSPGQGMGLHFAARLTAAILAVMAAGWLLAGGVAAGLESWRTLLASRLYLPPGLFRAGVTAPALLALVLIGVSTTIALVAVHGWYRLATRPHTNIARLWRSLLLSALAGALAGRSTDGLLALLLAVGGALAASVVALAIPAGAMAGPPPVPPRTWKQDRSTRLSLLNVSLVGFVIAFYFLQAMATPGALMPALSSGVCAVATGAVCGAGLGRLLLYAGLAADTAPFLVLVTIMLSTLLPGGPARGLPALGLVSAAGAACVILVARRISLLSGSVQYSLAWTGGALTCGAGVAFFTGLMVGDAPRWNGIGPYWGGLTAAVVGIGFLLAPHTRKPLRWFGTALAGIAAAAPFILAGPVGPGTSVGADLGETGPDPPAVLGREWLRTGALCWEVVGGQATARGGGGSALWEVDRGGPRADVLFVSAREWHTPVSPVAFREAGPRLLRRAARALLPGGRLVLELDPASPTPLPAWFSPEQILPDASAWRLRLTSHSGTYEAVLLGLDVHAWLAQRALPDGCTMSLTPASFPMPSPNCSGGDPVVAGKRRTSPYHAGGHSDPLRVTCSVRHGRARTRGDPRSSWGRRPRWFIIPAGLAA
jgi:hypothetical protein